jgi:hypothetical protein
MRCLRSTEPDVHNLCFADETTFPKIECPGFLHDDGGLIAGKKNKSQATVLAGLSREGLRTFALHFCRV